MIIKSAIIVFCSSNMYLVYFLLAGKVYGYGKSLSPLLWTWGSSSSKLDGFGKFNEEVLHNHINGSHCSTVERLYAWEKKLYLEVKVLYYLQPLDLISV